jgi:DNA-binding transcriptional ArsR family regulator
MIRNKVFIHKAVFTSMSRASLLLGIVVMLAVANTFPGFVWQSYSPIPSSQGQLGASQSASGILCYNCSELATTPSLESSISYQPTSQILPGNSPIIVTPGWTPYDEDDACVWRGKVRSRWESLGFDSGIFELFMRMKGAKTRLSLLDALVTPKDRMQLAQELGLDWKAIDYHVIRLNRYGLVHEDHAFGRVKLYRLTTWGETLLQLLKEFNREMDGGIKSAGIEAAAAHIAR